jgi:beta-lactamase regulating signal transducer with metallopeptidase domain
MDAPLRLLLTNAAAATLIAALAWAASLRVRRPPVLHGLWLLALLKLVTPPIAPLPLLPSWSGLALLPERPAPAVAFMPPHEPPETVGPARSALSAGATERRAFDPAAASALAVTRLDGGQWIAAPAEQGASTGVRWHWRLAAPLAIGLGGLAILALAALRFVCFGRLLSAARPAPSSVTDRASTLATRIGLRRAPRVRLVAAGIPPMLWPARGGPVLLLPQALVSQLNRDELDALLAHEIAHVRRRDHWVRLVEIAATALFWWYPVTWWTRRALRRAEERCCDEWVLRVLPRSAEAYASGLLKSLTFVAGQPESLPTVASGAGPVEDLEARLKEILMTRPVPQLAVPLRVALAVAAAFSLAVFPTHAQSSAAKDEPAASRAGATPAAVAPAPPTSARSASPATASASAARPAARPPRPAVAPLAFVTETPQPVPAPAPVPALVHEQPPDSPERRAFDEQRRALDEQRRKLHQQQLEIERQSIELEGRAEQAELRAEAERLRTEGRAEAAARVEEQARLHAKRTDLQRRQLQLEQEHARLEAEVEKAQREGEERAGDEMEKKQQVLQKEMQQAEEQLRALEAEQRVQELRGSTDDLARSLAEQIDSLKEALPDAAAHKAEVEHEIQRLEAALAALGGGSPAAGPRKTPRPQP